MLTAQGNVADARHARIDRWDIKPVDDSSKPIEVLGVEEALVIYARESEYK